ncbi:MAG: fructosamine kinase family protein [Pseudomonadota bacterium]
MISRVLQSRVESLLGQTVRSATRLTGGDINDAFELGLADQRRVFLKTNARAPLTMFAAEARGLEFLRQARALRVPEVLAASPIDEGPPFLLLEFIRSGSRRPDFDEQLGRGLANLHRFGAPSFGFSEENFIGRLGQGNRPHASWAEFYRNQRLEPQLSLAEAAGHATLALRRQFDRLFAKLPELVGEPEAPARLHGDLWGGNLHVDEQGAPCLIDPAVYGGHREMDLAMMRLFGGFNERVFGAYAEAFPLSTGHAERVLLCQLYPLLVHVNSFGGGYLRSVEQALSAYL